MIKTENNNKMKEQFQSTEDDNFGEEIVKITLKLGEQKPISKHFIPSQRISLILGEFDKYIRDFVDKSKTNYYAIVGFETVPFNYNLGELINCNS